MNITRYLNPLRLWYLFKRDFNSQWKDFLITLGGACGFFLIVLIITAKTGTIDHEVHYVFMSIILFVFGFIFTSMAFKQAHKKLLNHDWLMLPASTLEKFIEKLLLYTVVFSVVSVIFYTLFTLIARLVIQVFLGEYFPGFNPLNPIIWAMIGHYILAQSIFLLGAAWFKNNNFIKTILTMVIFSIILSLLSTLVGWIVFNDYFWTIVRADFNISMDFSEGLNILRLETFGEGLVIFMKIIYFGLMAPVCWIGAWLKLRELEVKDGI